MSLAQQAVAELNSAHEFFNRSTRNLSDAHSSVVPAEGMMTAAQQVAHTAQTVEWFMEGAFRPEGFDLDFEKHAAACRAVHVARRSESMVRAGDGGRAGARGDPAPDAGARSRHCPKAPSWAASRASRSSAPSPTTRRIIEAPSRSTPGSRESSRPCPTGTARSGQAGKFKSDRVGGHEAAKQSVTEGLDERTTSAPSDARTLAGNRSRTHPSDSPPAENESCPKSLPSARTIRLPARLGRSHGVAICQARLFSASWPATRDRPPATPEPRQGRSSHRRGIAPVGALTFSARGAKDHFLMGERVRGKLDRCVEMSSRVFLADSRRADRQV